MLAGHVEAQFLHHVDVIAKRLVGRGGVEPIGPEALIERAVLEIRLIVEHEAGDARRIFAQRNLPHADVGAHFILISADNERVEERRFGRP